jgi:class 3 adenylate cyclase
MANADFMATLRTNVQELMALDYDVQSIARVPIRQDVTFGDEARVLLSASLFIDIRNSTDLLQKYRKSSLANLLKSFHYICAKTIKHNCGEVRSFNGDSNLAIFAEPSSCDNAVSSAFAIKSYLDLILKPNYTIARDLDYGIGIDFGTVFVAKVGLSGEFNNDLIWIGACVNNASRMASKSKSPYNIHISAAVFGKLSQVNRIRTPFNLGNLLTPPGARLDIWKVGLLPPAVAPKAAPAAPAFPIFVTKLLKPMAPPSSAWKIYYTDYERPL